MARMNSRAGRTSSAAGLTWLLAVRDPRRPGGNGSSAASPTCLASCAAPPEVAREPQPPLAHPSLLPERPPVSSPPSRPYRIHLLSGGRRKVQCTRSYTSLALWQAVQANVAFKPGTTCRLRSCRWPAAGAKAQLEPQAEPGRMPRPARRTSQNMSADTRNRPRGLDCGDQPSAFASDVPAARAARLAGLNHAGSSSIGWHRPCGRRRADEPNRLQPCLTATS